MKESMFSVRQIQVVMALSIALRSTSPIADQSASEPALKAAFLYNFAKFTEWPADALSEGGTLTLCVIGDAAVAKSLEHEVENRQIARHPLLVQQMKADGPLRTCHVLYAGNPGTKLALQLLDAVTGAPVLTVSDMNRFAQIGGIAQLFIEAGRMRFAINVEAAQRSRLRLSSQLLALAKLVKDDPDALSR
jgi:hypothetical protein